MKKFLNPSLIEDLNTPLLESPIFYNDEKYKNKPFNLYCAVLDRLRTSTEYLNRHSRRPNTEEKTLSFFMHTCIVLDGIEQLAKAFNLKFWEFDSKNKEDKAYEYFKDVCLGNSLNIKEENCPTDYSFFKYLRALIFAHPFETSHQNFLKENKEIHFAPFIMNKYQMPVLCPSHTKDSIGIVIYSNKSSGLNLCVSFQTIKSFIASRYNLIEKITENARKIIHDQETEWLKRKVKKNCSPVETFEDMYDILKMRYQDEHTQVLELVEYLNVKSSLDKNISSIELYKNKVIGLIPNLSTKIEAGAIDSFLQEINKLVSPSYPRGLNLGYPWANILNRDARGLFNLCTKEFYENFAKKWVEIDLNIMPTEEVVLLCIVACMLESKEL